MASSSGLNGSIVEELCKYGLPAQMCKQGLNNDLDFLGMCGVQGPKKYRIWAFLLDWRPEKYRGAYEKNRGASYGDGEEDDQMVNMVKFFGVLILIVIVVWIIM